MGRVRDVVRFDVIRTLKKKAFWFTSFAPPLIMLTIIGISYLSNQGGKNAGQEQAAAYARIAKIAVLDDSGLLNKRLLQSRKIALEPNIATGIAAVKSGRLDAFLYYPHDLVRGGVKVYARDMGITFSPSYNSAAVQLLRQSIVTTIARDISDRQALQILQQPPAVTAVTYRDGRSYNALAQMVAPGAFMVFFLTIVILLSATMISSTTEEKENRTAEILLTCARARTLVWGKILSIISLGLIQVSVIAIPLIIYLLLFPKTLTLPGGVSLAQIPLDPEKLLWALAFFIGGFIFFTTLVVGLGAMFPNANEAGRFLGIAMIWAYVPIYIVPLIINSPHAPMVTIFTYFPLTAPTTALLLNTVGALSPAEAIGSLAVILASISLAIPFAARSFRYGALEYGRRLGFREIWQRN